MDPNQQLHQVLGQLGPLVFLFWGFAYVIKVTLYIIPNWQIAKKAGLSAPVALLCAIPLIGRLLTLYIIAFSQWRATPLTTYGTLPPQYPPQTYTPPTYPPQGPTA